MPGGRAKDLARAATLVETIVGLSVLVLCGLLSLGLLPSIKLSNQRAEGNLKSGALAQSLLEEARATPYDLLVSRSLSPLQEQGLILRARVLVTPGPVPSSKRVRAVVDWEMGHLKQSSFRETVLVKIPSS